MRRAFTSAAEMMGVDVLKIDPSHAVCMLTVQICGVNSPGIVNVLKSLAV
jgi:hypothetical protein